MATKTVGLTGTITEEGPVAFGMQNWSARWARRAIPLAMRRRSRSSWRKRAMPTLRRLGCPPRPPRVLRHRPDGAGRSRAGGPRPVGLMYACLDLAEQVAASGDLSTGAGAALPARPAGARPVHLFAQQRGRARLALRPGLLAGLCRRAGALPLQPVQPDLWPPIAPPDPHLCLSAGRVGRGLPRHPRAGHHPRGAVRATCRPCKTASAAMAGRGLRFFLGIWNSRPWKIANGVWEDQPTRVTRHRRPGDAGRLYPGRVSPA